MTPHLSESRGHILFADDDPSMLRATASALSVSGFEVTAVENGERALAALAARVPDVLLLDIHMPGNHNLDLVGALRREHPLLPIVLITGVPALDTARRAVRLGVVDYVDKSRELDDLIERLDVAVRRARALRSFSEAERAAGQLLQRLERLKEALCLSSCGQLAPAPHEGEAAAPQLLRNLPREELARLSRREQQVLQELARGHAPQRIAVSLRLSTNTVRNHLKSIFSKLRVNSQVALLAKLSAPRH